MTQEAFVSLCMGAIGQLRQFAPYKKGNLSNNGITYKFEGNDFKIYVDKAIAPYMPFTTEPWISPKWNGKQNPNQGWWDRTVKFTIMYLANELGGEVYELDDNNPYLMYEGESTATISFYKTITENGESFDRYKISSIF